MKSIARLTLYFSLCFGIVFLFSVFAETLAQWVNLARFLVNPPETLDLASILRLALVPALYISILFGLSYAARGRISFPVSMLCLLVLSFGLTLFLSLGIARTKGINPPVPGTVIRGEAGLILSRSDTAMVLLKTPQDIRGARVVSLPNQALLYQEQPLGPGNTVLNLPVLPFRSEMTLFFSSLLIDFSLAARQFDLMFNMGIPAFSFYIFALVFLLVSLRFIMELGDWPLANVFLGAVVFRGILALGTFLNAREVFAFLDSFLKQRIPSTLIIPLIFILLGLLVLIYTFLTHLVKDRRGINIDGNEDEN